MGRVELEVAEVFMCVDEATEEIRQIVDVLFCGDGFELELLGGEHPAFYLIRWV